MEFSPILLRYIIQFNDMLNLLPKAGLHNKYCVKKARWEEHIRSVKEEEEMILEMYRQYKVRRMFETFIK